MPSQPIMTADQPAKDSPWLSVLGIGDNGLASLTEEASQAIDEAEVIIGGQRHLALLGAHPAKRLAWRQPLEATLDDIKAHRGSKVVVLASGDPLWFGVGSLLARHFDQRERRILPGVSSFSLAAARLGWPLNGTLTLSLHNQPVSALHRHLAPGARLLLLTRNGETAHIVASLLIERGFAPSRMTVFEHLGGAQERRIDATAATWPASDIAALNLLALDCQADPARAGAPSTLLAATPGLPDALFAHDGMLTKREIRAITLARLIPIPGQTLWDIGAGSGAIAIEWLRAATGGHALAIEREATRAERIAGNAEHLGTPELRVIQGKAPACLEGDLPAPDAIFIGGGITEPDLLERCWQALEQGGRLVVNVVTLDGERRLLDWQAAHGGDLIRIALSRAEPIGPYQGWRPAMPVTQYAVVKP